MSRPCAGVAPAGAAPAVSDAEFRAFQRLVYAEAGIHLGPTKKALLAGRLGRRIRELQLDSLGAYFERVLENLGERVEMLDRITTNETRFFREPRQFELIESRLVPQWIEAAERERRPRTVRAWSAGCSSGEEPYSVAMTLLAQLPAEAGWQVEIVATDLSTRVLALARAGTYPLARAADIPERYLKRFVLRGVRSQEGCIRVARDVRDRVSFERLNLSSGAVPGGAAFDLVLCRNVLIYFDAASKARVLERLVARLATKGVLLLGHSETLGGADLGLRPLAPNAYFKPAAA